MHGYFLVAPPLLDQGRGLHLWVTLAIVVDNYCHGGVEESLFGLGVVGGELMLVPVHVWNEAHDCVDVCYLAMSGVLMDNNDSLESVEARVCTELDDEGGACFGLTKQCHHCCHFQRDFKTEIPNSFLV